MAIHDVKVERAALDARARAILDECPDVFRLIARGAAIDPEHEAIVYLRTALDPAPAVTTARSFLGFVSAAGRWLRENGVGPDDTVSILAPNCTAVSVAYWSAMSFCDRASAQPPVQPGGDRGTARRGQGENPVHPAAGRARRVVREGRERR